MEWKIPLITLGAPLNNSICITHVRNSPGRVAQSVMCLATDACLTADPGVASSIPARYHTFVEIDHEIISTAILLPSADLFKKGCCQLQAKDTGSRSAVGNVSGYRCVSDSRSRGREFDPGLVPYFR